MAKQQHGGRRRIRYLVGLLLFLLHPIGALASFTGPVVSVLDGDTIKVLHYTQPERIRLSGFDCPEKGQAYGNRAKQAASALVFGKDVILQTHGQDKYGRTLADVLLKDGTNVNHELVKAAGADGIGSMRRETQYSKGWRRMYERSR